MSNSVCQATTFHDDYDHPVPNIEYILENTLMPEPPIDAPPDDRQAYRQLADLADSRFTTGCHCATACGTACTCTRGHANYIASPHYPAALQLLLDPQRPSADLLYECGAHCACPPGCGNRLVQFGPNGALRLWRRGADDDARRGWGVLAGPAGLPAGAFVCEYAGEVLTAAEARRRLATYAGDQLNANYVMCLNERPLAETSKIRNAPQREQTFIDPTRSGNVGRYLNHSCEPNCEILSVRVDGPVPRLGE